MCAWWVRLLALGIGACRLFALSVSLKALPQPPNYSPLGFRAHPQTPLEGGISCSLLPFAVLIEMRDSQQTINWGRVVGPRGLSLDEQAGFPTKNLPLARCGVTGKEPPKKASGAMGCESRKLDFWTIFPGWAGAKRSGGRAFLQVASCHAWSPRPPGSPPDRHARPNQVWSAMVVALGVAPVLVYREAVPSLTVLTRCSGGGLVGAARAHVS